MKNIGFIGLGLIGGSLARAIRRHRPELRLIACSPAAEETAQACAEGVIDAVCPMESPDFSGCDLLFLCAPVQDNIAWLPYLKEHTPDSCILSDVGSVKGRMTDAVSAQGLQRRFIGGHPMAGTERSGFSASSDMLLENAWYFLTPTAQTAPEITAQCRDLITSIHALPLIVSPAEHDRIVAGVSHLPHIIASALVNTVRTLDTDDEYMKLVAAGGFRDITRIASSSPQMWKQICLTNRTSILQTLDTFIHTLTHARCAVENADGPALDRMFTASRNYRDSLDDTRTGSVPRQYVLYADIADETGGIATITTLLAMNGINIRNIGILHNREFEEGVLRIAFYDAPSRDHSAAILTKRNYTVRRLS